MSEENNNNNNLTNNPEGRTLGMSHSLPQQEPAGSPSDGSGMVLMRDGSQGQGPEEQEVVMRDEQEEEEEEEVAATPPTILPPLSRAEEAGAAGGGGATGGLGLGVGLGNEQLNQREYYQRCILGYNLQLTQGCGERPAKISYVLQMRVLDQHFYG